MQLKSKYITKEEYNSYFKEDLDLILDTHDGDNFLMRVENDLESFLNSRFGRSVDYEYPHFSDFQKDHYKLALLEQAHYLLKNGDILNDSGYNPDVGLIINKNKRVEIAISEKAKQQLMQCGLWTFKRRGGKLGGTIYFGGGFGF